MNFDTELWFNGQTEVTFIATETLPEDVPVSAVKIFDIADGRVLLVEVPKKGGWDIPGGHVEEGESAQVAAEREVSEETNGVVSELSLFGYLAMKKVVETPDNKDYPDQTMIAMYTGTISNIVPDSTLDYETAKMGYYTLEEVASLSPFWTNLSQQILDYAASR